MTETQCSLYDIQNQIRCIECLLFKPTDNFINLQKLDCDGNYNRDYDIAVRPRRSFLLTLLEELIRLKDEKRMTSNQRLNQLEKMILSYDFYRNLIINGSCISMDKICSEIVSRLRDDTSFVQRKISESDYQLVFNDCGIADMPKSKGLFLNELADVQNFFLQNSIENYVAKSKEA